MRKSTTLTLGVIRARLLLNNCVLNCSHFSDTSKKFHTYISALGLHLFLSLIQNLSDLLLGGCVLFAPALIEVIVLVTLARTYGLERVYALLRARPRVHLAVGLAALLRELVPVLGLGEELADRALRQAQYKLGEDTLTYVVQAEKVAHFLRYIGRVERLVVVAGVVIVVAVVDGQRQGSNTSERRGAGGRIDVGLISRVERVFGVGVAFALALVCGNNVSQVARLQVRYGLEGGGGKKMMVMKWLLLFVFGVKQRFERHARVRCGRGGER